MVVIYLISENYNIQWTQQWEARNLWLKIKCSTLNTLAICMSSLISSMAIKFLNKFTTSPLSKPSNLSNLLSKSQSHIQTFKFTDLTKYIRSKLWKALDSLDNSQTISCRSRLTIWVTLHSVSAMMRTVLWNLKTILTKPASNNFINQQWLQTHSNNKNQPVSHTVLWNSHLQSNHPMSHNSQIAATRLMTCVIYSCKIRVIKILKIIMS